MLVLTRKIGQSIELILEDGRVVTVDVGLVRQNGVRLGIHAPESIKIRRTELKPLENLDGADSHRESKRLAG